jgi:hypothetical protein
MEVGDWVNSYSAGVWRIYRIQKINSINIGTKELESRIAIFSARFLNRSFKRSFTQEVCDKSFVYPLDKNEKNKLDQFLSENPKVLKAFDDYKPEPIDSIYNANIIIPEKTTKEDLDDTLRSLGSKTRYEIYRYLVDSGLGSSAAKGLNAQFICFDHNYNENGELLYEFSSSF